MAAKFPHDSVADALERSLRNADLKAVNSAVVAAARVVAKRIDSICETGFIDENGKLDNVSLPTFLKYCQSLGLTVDAPAKVGRPSKPKAEARTEVRKSDKIVRMDEFMSRFG
jgi:ribosomal protein S8